MKLEHEIVEGIYIRKKFYCIKTSDNQTIIKASGVDSSRLNYDSFVKLLNGETVTIERINFNVDWTELSINVVRSDISIQGLTKKFKTLENILDTNCRFISFPIKYSIIIHPLHTTIHNRINQNIGSENKINSNNFAKLSVLEKLIIFIFLFSFVSLLSLFLYKIY